MTRKIFVGLDCEMTGTNYMQHSLIQIGMSIMDPRDESKFFVSDVGWDNFEYDPESLAVIKWDPRRIFDGPKSIEVEKAILDFFEKNGITKSSLVPVGYAVKTFDMPFVQNTFPGILDYFIRPRNLYNPFLYRCVDLSDVNYAMGYMGGKKEFVRFGLGKGAWKKAAKMYAILELEKMGIKENWHDAGYDARAAMLCLEFYTRCKEDMTPKQVTDLLVAFAERKNK